MFDKIRKNINFHSIFLIICAIGVLFLLYKCAVMFDPQQLPDELFRVKIPYYLYNFNKLPLGIEPEVIDPIWGNSYAFVPYLTSIIAYVFMNIAALFGGNLHVAMRLVSGLSVCGTILMAGVIGKDLFKKDSSAVLFAVLCGFLPQFIFLGPYFNNDAFSVFLSSVIIFCWIRGIKNNWSYKICILLGVALGCLALTYYSAYAFILMSIPLYFITYYNNNKGDWKGLIIKALLIFAIAFLIAGWFFIRNYFLWNGDFLGLETGERLSEESGALLKPSNRVTPLRLHESFYDAYFTVQPNGTYNWFIQSALSFVGFFGYMNVPMHLAIYIYYFALFGIGIVSIVVSKLKSVMKFAFKELFNNKNVLYLCFIATMIIPILLSMYNSYYSDYQAQGRYLMSMLLPLMAFVTLGYEKLLPKITEKFDLNYVIILTYIVMLLMVVGRYFWRCVFR